MWNCMICLYDMSVISIQISQLITMSRLVQLFYSRSVCMVDKQQWCITAVIKQYALMFPRPLSLTATWSQVIIGWCNGFLDNCQCSRFAISASTVVAFVQFDGRSILLCFLFTCFIVIFNIISLQSRTQNTKLRLKFSRVLQRDSLMQHKAVTLLHHHISIKIFLNF